MHWPVPLSPLQHGLFVLIGLLTYVVVTRIGGYHRHPSAAIAWVLMIALLPYLGLPLFLVFGTRKLVRPARRAAGTSAATADARHGPRWAQQLLAALDVPAPVQVETIRFHERGEESLATLLAVIGQARTHVDVCTYALGDDEVGAAVLDALAACARRGVRVRLLIDAIGGWRSVRSTLAGVRGSGVQLRWFMPVLRNPVRGRANLRDHRKIVVVDGQAFWSGGRNLAVPYFDDSENGWIDLDFLVYGPVARQAQALLEHDWRAARGDVSGASIPPVHDTAALREPFECAAASAASAPVPASGPVQLIPSGPDLADDTLHALLIAAAWRAERHIVAVTPYFVPEDALLDAWCVAGRRGVRIDLIVPQRSNHRMADLARGRALRALAAAGGRIFLHPRMVHAKLVIVDDEMALCGSANLDARSLLLNFELMTAFYGPREIDWLARWAQQQRERSLRYEPVRPSWGRDVLEGFVRAVGFQL